MNFESNEAAGPAPSGGLGFILPLAHSIARAAVDAAVQHSDRSIDPGKLVDHVFRGLAEEIRSSRLSQDHLTHRSSKPRIRVPARPSP